MMPSKYLSISSAFLFLLGCAENPDHTNVFDPETPNEAPLPVELTSDMVGEISDDRISFSWTESGEEDFYQYQVYRSASADAGTEATLIATLNYPFVTTLSDVGLQPNSEYQYQVSVMDKGGLSTSSNLLGITSAPGIVFCGRFVREGAGADFPYHYSKSDVITYDDGVYLCTAVLDIQWQLSLWIRVFNPDEITDRGRWHPSYDGTPLISGDSDGDGMPDMYEIIARTDPADPGSLPDIAPDVYPHIVPTQLLVIGTDGSASVTLFVFFTEGPYYTHGKILKFNGNLGTLDFTLDQSFGNNGVLVPEYRLAFGLTNISNTGLLVARREHYEIYDFNGQLVETSAQLPIRIGIVSVGSDTPGSERYYYLTNWDGFIYKYDQDGNELTSWSGFGENTGSLIPIGLYADERGNVFITDATRRTVNRFDSNGEFISRWDGANYGDLTKPFHFDEAIATFGQASIAGDGEDIVITDMNTAIFRAQY